MGAVLREAKKKIPVNETKLFWQTKELEAELLELRSEVEELRAQVLADDGNNADHDDAVDYDDPANYVFAHETNKLVITGAPSEPESQKGPALQLTSGCDLKIGSPVA